MRGLEAADEIVLVRPVVFFFVVGDLSGASFRRFRRITRDGPKPEQRRGLTVARHVFV